MKDTKEIEQMYREYAIPVKRYVLSLCKNNDMADDITADTFYKAIKNIDRFQGGKIFTWLCAIARNTYLDYIKKSSYSMEIREEEMEERISDDSPSPEDLFVKKDEQMTLYRMIQKLDAVAKDVVYLRIFAELSFKEIADIVGKSENWARVVFYRSKNKLKGWMNNEI